MYSLVIAEDELATRQGLVKMVPWQELGFFLDGEFSEGQKLLEYLKENVPDVILTDIDMSGVTGIDIACYVAEQKLPTQVIFLTAYRDFSYAKSAMDYRVAHYLLKPISIKELKKIFSDMKEKLDERKQYLLSGYSEYNGKNGSRIEKVVKYIQEHFNEDITLNDIAENVYLSPVYVSRLIKEQTGKNFVTLMMEFRIERAVNLLQHTELYVYEIAEQVGYDNLKYFYKVFRKVTGKSPNDYRKTAKEFLKD